MGCGNVKTKKDEVTDCWNVLYKEILHDLYSLPNLVIGEMKGNKMGELCSKYNGYRKEDGVYELIKKKWCRLDLSASG